MKIKLDNFERDIEKNLNQFSEISENEYKKINKIIDKANQKKIISIRINENDLETIKLKAGKEGMPYQTYISSVLHKYITNQLIDEFNIRKAIQLIKVG
ncbi:MAG TPA: hypothetical protein DC049_04755 [Spirochaetia bacterium]|nr:hypothetical protein [Spirochaetia bacterium]